jgi:hypothetical protein
MGLATTASRRRWPCPTLTGRSAATRASCGCTGQRTTAVAPPDREVRALQTRAVGLTVAMVAQMIVA